MGFSVYLRSGGKPIRIKDMNENDSIELLITKLKAKIKSTKLIVCIFNSVVLENKKTLKDYGIKRHDYIEYSENYKGGEELPDLLL